MKPEVISRRSKIDANEGFRARLQRLEASRDLEPRSLFLVRKFIVFLIIGPLNPIYWIWSAPLTGQLAPFTFWGFIGFWPFCFGALLFLVMHKPKRTSGSELLRGVYIIGLSTLCLYTFLYPTYEVIIQLAGLPEWSVLGLGADASSTKGVLRTYGFYLFFAPIIGLIPAIAFVIFTVCLSISLLYERKTLIEGNPTLTP